jgi:hypothetical protein
MERVGVGVADDQRVRAGGARGPDDRAEIPGALDALRHEEERQRRQSEQRERGRPRDDDRKQAVGPGAAGDRAERRRGQLDDGHPAALGARDERALGRPEVQVRRRVELMHARSGVERVEDLAIPLDEERVVGAPPPEPPEGFESGVRRAGDRESCHGSCFRGSGARRHEARGRLGRREARRAT